MEKDINFERSAISQYASLHNIHQQYHNIHHKLGGIGFTTFSMMLYPTARPTVSS